MLDLGKRKSLAWVDTEHWLLERLDAGGNIPVSAKAAFEPAAVAQGWTNATQAPQLLAFVDSEIADNPAVAERFRVFLAKVSADPGEMVCRECGTPMFIEENGVSHHAGGGLDGIDYNVDLQHVAVAEQEP